MRFYVPFVGVLALAGCASYTPVPDSARGVGFESYDAYLAAEEERRARLRGDQLLALTTVQAPERRVAAVETGAETTATVKKTATTTTAETEIASVAAETRQVLARTQTAETVAKETPAEIVSEATPTALALANNPTISDEQDFEAVSARESIESDKARLKEQREQFTVIEPTAVPVRTGVTTSNVVEYALATTNPVGNKIYRRTKLASAASHARNCASYGAPDIAQEAFLELGGPRKDRKNLDPDGDGYACGWDPTPFRLAVKSGG